MGSHEPGCPEIRDLSAGTGLRDEFLMATRSIIGDAPKRREDLRFVIGRGHYLDDLAFEGLAHAVVLGSPHAHALIKDVDTRTARTAPGVLAILTTEDARGDGLQPLRPTAEANV